MPSFITEKMYMILWMVTSFVVIIMAVFIYHLKSDLSDSKLSEANLKIELWQYKSALSYQNDKILSQKADYESKLKQLPKQIDKIKTRYVTTYQTVSQLKERNATDCNDSIDSLYRFDFVGVFHKAD